MMSCQIINDPNFGSSMPQKSIGPTATNPIKLGPLLHLFTGPNSCSTAQAKNIPSDFNIPHSPLDREIPILISKLLGPQRPPHPTCQLISYQSFFFFFFKVFCFYICHNNNNLINWSGCYFQISKYPPIPMRKTILPTKLMILGTRHL